MKLRAAKLFEEHASEEELNTFRMYQEELQLAYTTEEVEYYSEKIHNLLDLLHEKIEKKQYNAEIAELQKEEHIQQFHLLTEYTTPKEKQELEKWMIKLQHAQTIEGFQYYAKKIHEISSKINKK